MDAIDKIIERIKKAVRLANKTTESGERETALRLARNLAEKNDIALPGEYYDLLKGGEQKQTYNEIIAPVAIINAIKRSFENDTEEAVIRAEEI